VTFALCFILFFTGDQESNAKACEMILSKIVEDPLSGSCLNVSYAHALGPVANNCPTGSPFANLGGQRTPAGSFGSTASLNSPVTGSMYTFHCCVHSLYFYEILMRYLYKKSLNSLKSSMRGIHLKGMRGKSNVR
jgi:hypothetical protein